MRWSGQQIDTENSDALPGLARLNNLVRSVTTPEFAGVTFHEVLAKSALNHIPYSTPMPFEWTINPYRGCSHACLYCFARKTHEYLDLDGGRDFDTQVVVKVNVAEVLEREVGRASWGHHPVALGTNTDPYQRAEGRYRLMPGIIAALAASTTPFSILTKGTLLRRDLPLLSAAAERVPIDLAMSIAIYDPELQKQLEPGTPTTEARLATVRAATEAGFEVAVFLMPVLPFLTDTVEHLDRALGMIAESGAASVSYTALHLKPGVKDWFLQGLESIHPELVPRYEKLYGRGAHAPKEYRQWLASRIRPLLHTHGLDRPRREAPRSRPSSGTWSSPWARSAGAGGTDGAGLIAAELSPASAAAVQPTLF